MRHRATYTLLRVILSGIVCFICSCKKDPTGPVVPPPVDTTSHSIIWQKETFGVAASSYLLDVAIVNDTLALAVGSVWLEDRPGHLDPLAYNLLRWNGREWKAEHAGSGGGAVLRAICAFAPDDIWVALGLPEHWDVKTWTFYDPPGVPHVVANRLWGVSSSDLHMASDSGGIAHFDGASWTRLQTGTALKVKDIYYYGLSSHTLPSSEAGCTDRGYRGPTRHLSVCGFCRTHRRRSPSV